jgi:hypothetical protein
MKSNKRNVKKSASLIFTIFLAMIPSSCVSFVKNKLAQIDRESIQYVENEVAKDSKLKELDKICNDLPLVKEQQLIGKSISRKRRVFLSYSYKTNQNAIEMASKEKSLLLENGWLLKREDKGFRDFTNKYQKQNYYIAITYGLNGDASVYATVCEDLDLESSL